MLVIVYFMANLMGSWGCINFTKLFRNNNLFKDRTNLFNYNSKTNNYSKISPNKKNNLSDYKK